MCSSHGARSDKGHWSCVSECKHPGAELTRLQTLTLSITQQRFCRLSCIVATVKPQLQGLNGSTWWFNPVISRGVGSCSQSFPLPFLFQSWHCSPLSVPLSPSPPLSFLRSWRPRVWRPSAVRTETRRRSLWSPSSPSCSGRWVWVALLWASCSLSCSFCRNAKDTDDWDSIPCPGPRPPPGYCSSSVYVTYWDAQVKKGWPTCCFLSLQR